MFEHLQKKKKKKNLQHKFLKCLRRSKKVKKLTSNRKDNKKRHKTPLPSSALDILILLNTHRKLYTTNVYVFGVKSFFVMTINKLDTIIWLKLSIILSLKFYDNKYSINKRKEKMLH